MADGTSTFTMSGSRAQSGEDPLLPFLRGAAGAPVRIDMGGVELLDTLRLQILLSARREWSEGRTSFELVNMTEGLRGSLRLAGLDPDAFAKETGQ